ncbi:hypothetical protein GP486_008714, partial [Trichoglossum hirsutum]
MGMLDDYVKALQNVPMQEAIPGGAGTTPQGDPTAISSFITHTLGLPKQALESAQHDFTHNVGNPDAPRESVGPAFDTARALMGIGTPFAETNAAGIFGGRLSKTANLEKLDKARYMDNMEHNPTDIFQQTGWFKPPTDKLWRYEISDQNARMLQNGLDYSKDGKFVGGDIEAMFQHPDLYQAYPHLKDSIMYNTVYHNPANGVGRGSYNHNPSTGSVLEVEAPDLRRARVIGLHELQHAVQKTEGFASGGDPSHLAMLSEKYPSKIPMTEYGSNPYDMYQRLAGE